MIPNYLALFTSVSTLLCCALPSLFVLIGMGASFASLLETFPFLVTLSEYKGVVFTTALLALLLAGAARRLTAASACPTDPALAAACARTRRASNTIYALSWLLFLVGAFFAFLAPLVFI